MIYVSFSREIPTTHSRDRFAAPPNEIGISRDSRCWILMRKMHLEHRRASIVARRCKARLGSRSKLTSALIFSQRFCRSKITRLLIISQSSFLVQIFFFFFFANIHVEVIYFFAAESGFFRRDQTYRNDGILRLRRTRAQSYPIYVAVIFHATTCRSRPHVRSDNPWISTIVVKIRL